MNSHSEFLTVIYSTFTPAVQTSVGPVLHVTSKSHKAMPDSRKRKRSGGQRQRLAQHVQEELTRQSALAQWLLMMFAWGHFSVQRCQNISKLVMQDLEKFKAGNTGVWDDVEVMSKLGSGGLYQNKMHADLMRKCSGIAQVSEPYEAQVDYLPPLGVQKQDLLLPHEVFSSIYHHYPATWRLTMVPNESKVAEFWEAVKDHPTMVDSPLITDKANYRTRCVPIILHGDGAPITGIGKGWSKNATVFSWASMLVHSGTKEGMRFIWGAFDKLCKTDDVETGAMGTFSQFFRILTWSLHCLYSGKFPERDHLGRRFPPDSWRAKVAGQDLAHGWTGYLFSVIGDLDYFAAILKLPHFSRAGGPCPICRCTLGGNLTWTNMQKTADWIGTLWKKDEWFLWDDRSKNPLFNQLPGQSCHTVALDLMHTKYLGHDMYVHGSVLALLCQSVLQGTEIENLRVCWDFLKRYYKQHGIPSPYRYLNKISMFVRQGRFPKLRGKAAEVRHLAIPLAALWKHYMNDNILLHRQIHLLLRLNIQFEKLIDDFRDSYALPEHAANALTDCAFSMMQICTQCAEHFLDDGIPLFDLTSKSHFVVHIAMLSRHVNPRLTWCFRGEDMMRKVQELLQSCVRGNHGALVFRKMISHYRLGLHLLFDSHRV